MTVLITASASAPASMHCRAFSWMSVWLGDSDQRLVGQAAARGDDFCRHVRVVAERDATFLDVRAGDIDLDCVDRRVVEAPRDGFIGLDGRTAGVGDEPCLAEIEPGQDFVDDLIDARVLQADRVQHAHRRLVDPVRGVAESGFVGGALEDDRTHVAVRESVDSRVLLAKPYAAGQQHDRRIESQPAEAGLQRVGWLFQGYGHRSLELPGAILTPY